jgi:PAS domain S-box-containing protein
MTGKPTYEDLQTRVIERENYRSLLENMTQGAFRQRADGVLLDVNPAALRMFGLTRDEFLQRTSFTPDWEVVHEDGTPAHGSDHPSMVALRTGKAVGQRIWRLQCTNAGMGLAGDQRRPEVHGR